MTARTLVASISKQSRELAADAAEGILDSADGFVCWMDAIPPSRLQLIERVA